MSMSPSTEPAAVTATEESPQPALSNRGNKLTGQENPGSIRPKMKWNRSRQEIKAEDHDENMDFENYEKMFLRKIKYNSIGSSVPFVRFLNEFEAQKNLFSKEGIELDKIFKDENLAKRPLSRYTQRALQNRHLEVLVTLLMLKIEEEQEEYRKLMRLAEELCIENGGGGGFESSGSGGEELVFKRETLVLEGVDSEEILELKALCHEHLHLKRVYISMLRKIRSGAVYSLFQANNIYQKLRRLDRKLAVLREGSDDEEEKAADSADAAAGSANAM